MKESEFSKSMVNALHCYGYNVTRLESHGTAVGIPDMFVQGRGTDFWLELKSMPGKKFGDMLTVPWRPGQQAWMYDYYLAHGKHKCCLTVVKLDDRSIMIPMTQLFTENRVTSYDYTEMFVSCMHRVITYQEIPKGAVTYRDAINVVADNFDMDYDPDVIWDSLCKKTVLNDIDETIRPIVWNLVAKDVTNYFYD